MECAAVSSHSIGQVTAPGTVVKGDSFVLSSVTAVCQRSISFHKIFYWRIIILFVMAEYFLFISAAVPDIWRAGVSTGGGPYSDGPR